MAKKLKQIFTTGSDQVVQKYTINSWHVSQSVDALTGAEDYDITISGSLTVTGSIFHNGVQNAGGAASSVLVRDNSTGEYYITGAYSAGAAAVDTGSFYVSSSVNLNTITFTQGDGTTESVTVDTGSGAGSTDYVSNVQFSDPNLVFTGIGSAFNGSVDLSSLIPAVPNPGGSNTQIQYNNNGSFGGANLYYDNSTHWIGLNVPIPSAILHISGSTSETSIYTKGRVGIGNSLATNGFLEIDGNVSGTSIYASANIVAYSDARSKTNVTTIDNALDKVDAIRGVTYNKVEDPDGIRYMGVIAQELKEVLPEVVAEGEDGKLAVAYGNIVGVLIEAVKELRAEIKELKSNK